MTRPESEEYSRFSPRANNGVRIDHAYVISELAQRVTACEFDHTPRLLRETDHSALVVCVAAQARILSGPQSGDVR